MSESSTAWSSSCAELSEDDDADARVLFLDEYNKIAALVE
jgi:hypothetical protein